MLIDPPASKSTEVQFDRQSLRTGHLTEMAEDHRYFLGLNRTSILLSCDPPWIDGSPQAISRQCHAICRSDGHRVLYLSWHAIEEEVFSPP
jgi:hypothetical protein